LRRIRRFALQRNEDESGISGTGIVAEGVQFITGKAVLNWTTDVRSVAVYDSLDELMAIHGHDGKTILVWIDQ
jgi:hypothetical protein